MPDLTFRHEGVILDACCVMNLYASRRMADILESIPKTVAVAAYVRDEETLWVYSGPDNHVAQAKERIDLQPLVEKGLLTIVSPDSEAEKNTFVAFAAVLGDDGESVTGAIAMHRHWAVATDDKKALNFFAREAPHLQVISTLELVKYWVDLTSPTPDDVFATLRHMRLRAKYKPGDKHALYTWWQNYKTDD